MIKTGTVKAVCISEKKGTAKTPVPEIALRVSYGIEGDAHAGDWHRQVSLLGIESVNKLQGKLPDLTPGAFAENILTEGITLYELPVGTDLRVGEALLEVTQIGKECHDACEIRKKTGDCVMPREGIFAVVRKAGTIRAGDDIEAVHIAGTGKYTAAVITVSDKSFEGRREDLSGPAVREMLESAGYSVIHTEIVPDEQPEIESALIQCADEMNASLVITTGGTGFAPRDVTPEATLAVIERRAPGIPEAMRGASLRITDRAMLSRCEAGLRGTSLIINLPGSPKAARENLSAALPALEHGLEMLLAPPQDHD